MNNISIIKEEKKYDGFLKIYEATIEEKIKDKVQIYNREKLVRKNAVTGLLYNTDSESVIFVEQYRYPVSSDKKSGYIFESIAGLIDEGYTPTQTFIKESLEEVGYKINEKNIQLCFSCYSSPGYSTEKVYYFLAKVKNKDKVKNAGGGVQEEGENIRICEFHYLEFKSMMEYIEDAKLKLLFYEAHYKNFFDDNKK